MSGASPNCASSTREEIPSIAKMLRSCASIVLGERKSRAATSRFESPSATRRAICSSCGESRDRVLESPRSAASPLARKRRTGAIGPPGRAKLLERLERGSKVLPRFRVSGSQALAEEQLGSSAVERAIALRVQPQRVREAGRSVL